MMEPMRFIVSTMTTKHRITIPVEIRRYLGLSTPGRVVFLVDDEGNVELRGVNQSSASPEDTLPPLVGGETTRSDDMTDAALEEQAIPTIPNTEDN
jgi:AbrB family looped-hinge helix DNA binding protein